MLHSSTSTSRANALGIIKHGVLEASADFLPDLFHIPISTPYCCYVRPSGIELMKLCETILRNGTASIDAQQWTRELICCLPSTRLSLHMPNPTKISGHLAPGLLSYMWPGNESTGAGMSKVQALTSCTALPRFVL